ncbi:hypothetical protein QJQ45_026671, partial [Haematococcus lacustris]
MAILLQGWQLGWLAAGPAPPVSPSSSYWELLNNPEQESTIFGNRARSAMDSNVLRRKGHLKEQDYLIDYMRRMHETHTCEEVMLKMERWIAEHRQDPRRSRLRRLVPQLGNFFTSLRLVDAFREYDAVFALSSPPPFPPSPLLILAPPPACQVHASADAMKLITFDADGTLYADGSHFQQDNAMIAHIINLMRCNVHVGIVTAAGYPGEAHKFESRLAGLLETFRKLRLPAEIINRFHVMGGECNYLLRVTADTKSLEFVPEPQWQTPPMQCWKEEDIQAMLDGAEALLVESAQRLNLPISLIRKNRSVGIVPQTATIYEVLEDIALTVQNQLVSRIPFCAFNGGNDVFVDAGNKSLGLQAMMAFTGAMPHETLHVGDRFTLSGNDTATRDVCSVLWVANPEETGFFIRMLLKDIRRSRWQPYIDLECSSECGLVTELLHDSSFELGALAALWPSEEPLLTVSSTATLVAVGSGGGSSSGLQSLAAVAGADEMPAARPGTWQWSDIVEATYTGITGGQLGAATHALCISASTTEDVVLFHTGHTGQGVPGLGVADTRVSMGLSYLALITIVLIIQCRMPAEGKLRRFHQQLVEAVKHLGPQFARIPVQRSPRFAEGTQEPRPLPGLLFPNLGAGVEPLHITQKAVELQSRVALQLSLKRIRLLSRLDTMELARQLGAAPLLVLSLSSPASPGHNPDLLPLTQAYQQLGAAVRASFPHLQLLACADLGTLPVMDGWELQAQLDPDTTARLGEALDTYQGKPLSVVLGQPHRLQGTGARPGDSVLAGLMAAARSLVLERHCDRPACSPARLPTTLSALLPAWCLPAQVTMVSSQGLLLPAQKPSQPWGKHHSLIVYSATHQPLETPAAQLHHLLRQHQGSLCAKDWQLLSSPDDSGQVESSASCNDAACTHLILKLVNQGHMKQAVTVTIQHTVPPPAPSWWSQTPHPPRLLLAGSEATTWAVKGPDDAGPTFEHPSNQLFQAQPAQLTVVPTVSDNTHVSLIVQLLPHSFTVAHLHLAQEPHDPLPRIRTCLPQQDHCRNVGIMQAPAVLFVIVQKGSYALGLEQGLPQGARYTRDGVRALLLLVGCKPVHAHKVVKRLFRTLSASVPALSKAPQRREDPALASWAAWPTGQGSDVCVSLPRPAFFELLCTCLAEYKYRMTPASEELKAACSLVERRRCMVVLLCGTSGSGKSTLASILASRLGISTVLSTDSVRHMLRTFYSEQQAPALWVSTYQAGEALLAASAATTPHPHPPSTGPPLADQQPAGPGTQQPERQPCGQQHTAQQAAVVPAEEVAGASGEEAEAGTSGVGAAGAGVGAVAAGAGPGSAAGLRAAGSGAVGAAGAKAAGAGAGAAGAGAGAGGVEREACLQGYKAQCEPVMAQLDALITVHEARRESLIIEGVHLHTGLVLKLMQRHPSLVPFCLFIKSPAKHCERMAVRAKYMTLV